MFHRLRFSSIIALAMFPASAWAQNLLPSLDNPKLRFGTGGVKHNQPEVSDLLPDLPGPASGWYLAQWHQNSIISAGSLQHGVGPADPLLGLPLYSYTSPNKQTSITVYKDKESDHLVWRLYEHGGWLTNGGGSNLFLSTNLPRGGVNFSQHLTFSFDARLTDAMVQFSTPTAERTGAVLGMAFSGMVVTFPNPLTGIPSTLFLQLSLANSLERTTPQIACREINGSLRILFGGYLGAKLPLSFTPGSSLEHVSYNLNQYENAIFGEPLHCSINGKNTMVSMNSVNPAKIIITSLYIGLETENIDKRPGAAAFGRPQGDVAMGLEVSNPTLTAIP